MLQNMPLLNRVLGTAALASVITALLMSHQFGRGSEPPMAKYGFTRSDFRSTEPTARHLHRPHVSRAAISLRSSFVSLSDEFVAQRQ